MCVGWGVENIYLDGHGTSLSRKLSEKKKDEESCLVSSRYNSKFLNLVYTNLSLPLRCAQTEGNERRDSGTRLGKMTYAEEAAALRQCSSATVARIPISKELMVLGILIRNN